MGREGRIARNEALFREVNERVREVQAEEPGEHVGFLCECGRESCTETVFLTIGEYEEVRLEPTHFVVVPGHEIGEVEAPVERHSDRFVVVRKHSSEARVAMDTDPRA